MADVPVLHFVSGKYAGQEFPLDPAGSVIAGRSSEADVVLADDAVSRKHARFYHTRGRTWVRDLGSRNGTLVNGQRIERHCLRAGDRIAIGASLMKVMVMESSQVSGSWRGAKRRGRTDESASRSMSGSIEDIPLVDVLQWLATSRKTGTLKVRAADGGKGGLLHLRDGRVYYAQIEGNRLLNAEKALIRMLLWSKGSFELDANLHVQTPSEMDVSLEHLLMEAARQSDELANLAQKAKVPPIGADVKLVRPGPIRWKDLEPAHIDLVQELAEGKTWTEILDGSAIDDLALTRSLVALHKKGVVTF